MIARELCRSPLARARTLRRDRATARRESATGTVGGLCFAAWAGADRLWSASGRARLRRA